MIKESSGEKLDSHLLCPEDKAARPQPGGG